jgi:hypothetical protein
MKASGLTGLVASILAAAFFAVPGCGDDEPPKEEPQGDTIECSGLACHGVTLPEGYDSVEPCCAANGACGLDGSQFEQYGANFEDDCQPLDQPGDEDPECDDSVPVATDFGPPLVFDGCCTPAGRCGYLVNEVFLFDFGLGCVDAAPFLDGGVPESCTPGAGGAPGQ